jgi:ADP-ribose pyrophosphatase YjhB (NUDIX family)
MRVFATTIPKAGTKLLEQVLVRAGFSKANGTLEDGQFLSRHQAYDRRVLDELPAARFMVLVRDPRDIVVSHVHYALSGNGGVLAQPARRLARDAREHQALVYFGMVARDLRQFEGWLDEPRCLVLRFEDIVGPQFGGSVERQSDTAARLAEWLQIDPVRARAALDTDTGTSTFRSGLIGGWRAELDPALAGEITDLHRGLLERLSYPI